MQKNKGFTLIELSIVIVIIGLIVAGVVGGQSLVQQAKLRSTFNEISKLKLAITAFKAQYNYLPGDISNAFGYWGLDCADTDTLCNGNGDGKVGWLSTEQYRVWQHLALADIIPGTYTGIQGTPRHSTAGINSPALPIENSVINLIDAGVFSSSGNYLYYARSGPVNNFANGGLLSPNDARNIDLKADDGAPATGRVQTINGWDPNHAAGGSQLTGCTSVDGMSIPVTATYSLENQETNCIMAFFLDYQ